MLVYEFAKNCLEKVKIEINPFNGQDYINIRVYFQDDQNKWKPSHKGITLSLDKIAELKTGIDKAYRRYYKEADSDKKTRLESSV